MGGKQQKSQLRLALWEESTGETRRASQQGTEPSVVPHRTESQACEVSLMEQACADENVRKAAQKVRSNKGTSGVDGMTGKELEGYLRQHWPEIREQLLAGTYRPSPVQRVWIPKPTGGKRKLGVPTVLDRCIQQAVLQVLTPIWDPTFSDHSYGFRPGRCAHQAVAVAQQHIADGCRWVVDMDLSKFFDRVNHDRLMARLATRVKDRRVLRLIGRYLRAGVLEDGLISPSDEGTPQGGPLSPLLSNIVLDELDRELEDRGHRFVRYADDFVIYVKSRRAGERVMQSVSRFVFRKLKLKVNRDRSAVDRPWRRSFLSFTFSARKEPRRWIAPKALKRFKVAVRQRTRRSCGRSLRQVIEKLAKYLDGWLNYFGFAQVRGLFKKLESWIRHRLRCPVWKHWKRASVRYARLRERGVSKRMAASAAAMQGLWHAAASQAMHQALPSAHFSQLGLPSLTPNTQ